MSQDGTYSTRYYYLDASFQATFKGCPPPPLLKYKKMITH